MFTLNGPHLFLRKRKRNEKRSTMVKALQALAGMEMRGKGEKQDGGKGTISRIGKACQFAPRVTGEVRDFH